MKISYEKQAARLEAKKDRPWLIMLGGAKFLLTAAMVIYWAVFQGFVVKRLGGQYLPHFFLLVAIAAVISGAVSIRILNKWSASRQSSLYLFLGLPVAIFIAAIQPSLTVDSPLLVKLSFVALGAAVIAALVQSPLDKIKVVMADALPAERLEGIDAKVTGLSNLGIVLTGLALAFLGERLGSGTMFWTAAVLTGLALPFYLALEHRIQATGSYVPAGKRSAEGRPRFLADVPPGSARRAIILLTALVSLTVVFGKIFNYEFMLAASAHFPEEAQVSAFVGGYFAVVGLVLALFVTGLRHFLLRRFGLTRNLHVPTALVALGVLLTAVSPAFLVVIGVVFARDVIMTVQQYAFTVMLQAVGDQQRNQAWSWIDGPITAVAGVLGSLLLLLFPPDWLGGPYGSVRALAAVLAVMLIVRFLLTRRLERLFPEMLVAGLKKGDFKTRIRSISLMEELRFMRNRRLGAVLDVIRDETEPAAVRLAALRTLGQLGDATSLRVIAKMVSHPEPDIRRAAIRAVAKFDFRLEEVYSSGFARKTLIRRLREIFREETDMATVQAILDALIALRDEDIVSLLSECLRSDDIRLQRSCLVSLRRFSDAAVIDEVRDLLDSPEPAVRADAIAALWQFSWERPDKLVHRLEALVKSDSESDQRLWGVYLIGELKLGGYRQGLQEALSAERQDIRLAASVSLLKLGDARGITLVEEVLARGEEAEAGRLAGLVMDTEMPEESRRAIEAAVHRHHLHYPPGLPVTEPLRRRLAEIPKECLRSIMLYYPSPAADTDRAKIEAGLDTASQKTVGRVALYGLAEPWLTMAAVHLLAHGYQVRAIGDAVEAQPDEAVVADAEAVQPPPGAVVMSDQPGQGRVVKSHFAPSELRRAIERLEMAKYL